VKFNRHMSGGSLSPRRNIPCSMNTEGSED